jgi:DNA-binding MarR family transcriptional regulator/catechol 2,3-dioxygenase-like lactoylglutathione lyase family enzyme
VSSIRRVQQTQSSDDLCGLLQQVGQMRGRAVLARIDTQGLTRAQLVLLCEVARANGLAQADLAARLEIGKTRISTIVRELEGLGWLNRRSAPADRRTKCVFLTTRAWDFVDEFHAALRRLDDRMFVGVSAEERRRFDNALARLRANAGAIAGIDHPADSEGLTDKWLAAAEGPPAGAADGLRVATPAEQRLSLLTIGVADVARSRRFYEQAFGWIASPASSDVVAFFQLDAVVLAIYERAALAEAAHVPLGAGFGGIALAHNVRSPDEIESILARVTAAGGRLLYGTTKVRWGALMAGFADPDGHPWCVSHSGPLFSLRRDGSLALPRQQAFTAPIPF